MRFAHTCFACFRLHLHRQSSWRVDKGQLHCLPQRQRCPMSAPSCPEPALRALKLHNCTCMLTGFMHVYIRRQVCAQGKEISIHPSTPHCNPGPVSVHVTCYYTSKLHTHTHTVVHACLPFMLVPFGLYSGSGVGLGPLPTQRMFTPVWAPAAICKKAEGT